MFVVRPIKSSDLDQLYKLSAKARVGITTLPYDKKLLAARIKESVKSFSRRTSRPGPELYFFVMENTRTGRLVGTSAIVARVGGVIPSYTYKIKKVLKKSNLLHIDKEIQFLKLKKEYEGPSEIGTLFIDPAFRKKGCGRLLALSRFLLVAQYPRRFQSKIIAELRGVLNEQDRSPFWNAVCKHFFMMEFKKADLMVMRDKTFIEELIPKHPIYIPILPEKAQAVIGQVHKNTVPALKLLEQEGFKFINEIDIFEAGPVVGAKTKEIRTIKKSREAVVENISDDIGRCEDYLIANVTAFEKFCVTKDKVALSKKGVTITKNTADALKVFKGQKLRIVKTKE